MKKIKLISLFGVMLFSICNCTKAKVTPLISNNDISIIQKMKDFHQKITEDLKSDLNIQIDTAVFQLECDLNYNYCFNDSLYSYSLVDTSEFRIATIDDSVSLEDLSDLYDEIIDSLSRIYDGINNEHKFLVAVCVQKLEVNREIATFRNISIFGYEKGTLSYGQSDFGNEDIWVFGHFAQYNGGKCSPYSGYNNLDAGILICQKILLVRPIVAHAFYLYTQPAIVLAISTPDGELPYDNWLDFKMWSACGCFGSVSACLSPTQMNYHRYGTQDVVDYYADWYQKTMISLNIVGFGIIWGGQPGYCHEGAFFYGKQYIDVNRNVIPL